MKTVLDWVRSIMKPDDGWIYLRVKRGEDYADVHEELVLEDFLATPYQWEIELVTKGEENERAEIR